MKNQQEQKNVSPLKVFRDKLGISNGRFFTRLQFLGKAMLFPIIVLPLAAIFLRFGTLMTDTSLKGITENNAIWYIGKILTAIGQPAFDNLHIIFGIGLAFGLANDHRGEAALAGAMASWVLASLLTENSFASLFYNKVLIYHSTSTDDPLKALEGYSQLLYMIKNNQAIYALNIGVLGGLVAGGFTAWSYNKWHTIKMPAYLSFIEGRRFIPLISILLMVPTSLFFAIIWPWVQFALVKFGVVLTQWGTNNAAAFGVSFIHTLFKSILVLFGLHNVLNTFLWFQLPFTNVDGSVINGDIPAFTAGIKGSGLFQVGSFAEIMGGYWGLSLAIIFCAKKENRKEVASLMLPLTLACSLTGVGEPLILPIWYASPLIYLVQSLLNSVFGAIPAAMGVRAGFAFSAGWVDFVLSIPTSWKMASSSSIPWLANPLWLIPNAILTSLAYFGVFSLLIRYKDLKTLGRGENEFDQLQTSDKNEKSLGYTKKLPITSQDTLASNLFRLLKEDNIVKVDNCATRLRLELKDNSIIDDQEISKLKIYGFKKSGPNYLQIIIGSGVQEVSDELNSLLREKNKQDVNR
ncbi:PTS system N-acetylglucosamine-specific IIC component [Entomoplasma freundtii]|uniref:PTS system, N-acetylglucosamine-specific IIBC component n=1 Tax=Entomoplasma freundtii TaxID=74700 RepID=A0A2K8NRX0_9MOLU|nr:PTS transporter subunit EIIC [Entomoplasma freundtii]ATZ16296.1 PTS system, N-acetylglucosamine-specific IIBC component [Entomoplasma freundtii]TDY56802.1 PTS system N-acetylglucosamine-specific IIC component [Entomoplasma freundtii]